MSGYLLGVGPVATQLLDRASQSTAGMVAIKDYREMRSARKLARRGVLVQYGMMPFFFLSPNWADVLVRGKS